MDLSKPGLSNPISIGRKKALYADVNFQNYLQYSINPRLISRISSNPNNVSRIFRHFKQKSSLANGDALPPIGAS
jgi:hypothetical protein